MRGSNNYSYKTVLYNRCINIECNKFFPSSSSFFQKTITKSKIEKVNNEYKKERYCKNCDLKIIEQYYRCDFRTF